MAQKGLKRIAGACFVVAAVLAASNLMSRQSNGPEPLEEKRDMILAEQPLKRDVTIPPIDASAPAHTETATFALG
jgi:hypothetical protein